MGQVQIVDKRGSLYLLRHPTHAVYTVARIDWDLERVWSVIPPDQRGMSLPFTAGNLYEPVGVICGWYSKGYARKNWRLEVNNGV
jgi:hypothetical protein